jgi:hypothetical protein
LTDAAGQPVPGAVLRHAEPEAWHGERILHLQANAPRAQLDRKAVQARFSVRWVAREE